MVIGGQSNASGRGTNNQQYTPTTVYAYNFTNAYTLTELSDPVDSATGQTDTVSSDTSPAAAGSCWPLLATQMMARTHRSALFVPCALGGTSITQWLPGADHQDRTMLYGSLVYRTLQAMTYGRVLCLMMHIGETDGLAGMAQAVFRGHLGTFVDAIWADLAIPVMFCKLQNSSGIPDVDEAKINAAIADLWATHPHALAGPDFTAIASDDSFHLQTNAKLLTAATGWYNALVAAGII